MGRLAIVIYLGLAVACVFGVVLPPAVSPPISLPEDWVAPINVTDVASLNNYVQELPMLAARADGPSQKDYTDQPPPPPPAKPRPQKFTPKKIARCIFTLDTGPCCGPLSNPPPWSDECIKKWGDPAYNRQDERDFCEAQPGSWAHGQCGVIDEDGYAPVMVVPERVPGYAEEDQVYTTRLVSPYPWDN